MNNQLLIIATANLVLLFGLILSFQLKKTNVLFFVFVGALVIMVSSELSSRKMENGLVAIPPVLVGLVFTVRSIPFWLQVAERPDLKSVAVLWNVVGMLALACGTLLYLYPGRI